MKNFNIIAGILIIAIIIVAAIVIRKSLVSNTLTTTGDSETDNDILTLHPLIRSKAACLINNAKKENIILKITSGIRSFAEQTELYNQGRTAPGDIVTNAPAGYSYHNYGLAFDVVPIENNIPNYNSFVWDKIGAIGRSCGLIWGGDFSSIIDKPHFQFTNGKTETDLLALYNSGNFTSGFVNIT